MAISIDENLLLGIAALVFIPVFLFCIKMIMKVGTLESKIDNVTNHLVGTEKANRELTEAKTDIKLIELRVKGLEKDVDYLLSRDRGRSGQSLDTQSRTIKYNYPEERTARREREREELNNNQNDDQ